MTEQQEHRDIQHPAHAPPRCIRQLVVVSKGNSSRRRSRFTNWTQEKCCHLVSTPLVPQQGCFCQTSGAGLNTSGPQLIPANPKRAKTQTAFPRSLLFKFEEGGKKQRTISGGGGRHSGDLGRHSAENTGNGPRRQRGRTRTTCLQKIK